MVTWDHPVVEELKRIADGEAFDLSEGIRAIATYLVTPAEVTVEEILQEDASPASEAEQRTKSKKGKS